MRERGYDDNATLSAKGIAAANLVCLAFRRLLVKAEATLNACRPAMEQQIARGCSGLFTALDQFRTPALVKTEQGRIPSLAAGPETPHCFAIAPDLPTGSISLVCQGMACSNEPGQSLGQLEQQLRDRRGFNLIVFN